jgi:hypothetical protein
MNAIRKSHTVRSVFRCLPLIIALAVSGCSKKASPVAAPAPGTNSPAAPAQTPAPEFDLTQMTRDLRRWIVKNQRPPKHFEEFAATSGNQYPAPPAGKKFAIDKSMHVVLVKQ